MTKKSIWDRYINAKDPPFDDDSMLTLLSTLAKMDVNKVFDEKTTTIKISVGLKYLLNTIKKAQNFENYNQCVAYLAVLPFTKIKDVRLKE